MTRRLVPFREPQTDRGRRVLDAVRAILEESPDPIANVVIKSQFGWPDQARVYNMLRKLEASGIVASFSHSTIGVCWWLADRDRPPCSHCGKHGPVEWIPARLDHRPGVNQSGELYPIEGTGGWACLRPSVCHDTVWRSRYHELAETLIRETDLAARVVRRPPGPLFVMTSVT